MTKVRLVLALCALIALVAVVAGCGGVPGNAVATVDGNSINKDDFNHWMNIAAKTSGQPNASVPDAPDFKKCIEQKSKSLPKPKKGEKPPSDDQLKQQCQQEYNALRDQVMQLLTSFQWIEGEAKVPPRYAPELGEHSAAILAEVGYSEAEIDRMIADGVVVQDKPAAG